MKLRSKPSALSNFIKEPQWSHKLIRLLSYRASLIELSVADCWFILPHPIRLKKDQAIENSIYFITSLFSGELEMTHDRFSADLYEIKDNEGEKISPKDYIAKP
jgi:hypothetical protein